MLFDVLPIETIEETTWSAIFRDALSTDRALRYLFPERSITEDPDASRRLGILRLLANDPTRAGKLWRSADVLASSPDLSDVALFAFTAELARNRRGAPMSTHHLAERLVRSLGRPDAVATLKAMCSGSLGADRFMVQYDMEAVNSWFVVEGEELLAVALRTRVRQALFGIGFTDAGVG